MFFFQFLESPAASTLADELLERVTELQFKVKPIQDIVSKCAQLPPSSHEIAKYLQAKQQMMLSYCINLVQYAILKVVSMIFLNTLSLF